MNGKNVLLYSHRWYDMKSSFTGMEGKLFSMRTVGPGNATTWGEEEGRIKKCCCTVMEERDATHRPWKEELLQDRKGELGGALMRVMSRGKWNQDLSFRNFFLCSFRVWTKIFCGLLKEKHSFLFILLGCSSVLLLPRRSGPYVGSFWPGCWYLVLGCDDPGVCQSASSDLYGL